MMALLLFLLLDDDEYFYLNSIDDIKQSFDDVKDQISSIIVDNSDTIDKYTKSPITR